MNKKKNLLWLLSLLMIVSVSFTSCNKDDDDDVDLKTAIIGKWKSVSDVYYVDGKEIRDESVYYTDDRYYVDELKSDGTYLDLRFVNGVLDEKENDLGEWKLEGDTLIFDDDMEYKVTINGNTLILTTEWTETDDGVAQKWKIVETYTKL